MQHPVGTSLHRISHLARGTVLLLTLASGAATEATHFGLSLDGVRVDVDSGAFPHNPADPATVSGVVTCSDIAGPPSPSVFIDFITRPITATVAQVSVSIRVANGDIPVAEIYVRMSDGSTLTAQVNPRVLAGTDLVWSGGVNGSYRFDGELHNARFSGPLFAGVDVSAFYAVQPVAGTFYDFAFRPSVAAGTPGSFDNTTSMGIMLTSVHAPLCAGDSNGDETVDFGDITVVLANFGRTYDHETGAGDTNHDRVVNFADITASLANFGSSC